MSFYTPTAPVPSDSSADRVADRRLVLVGKWLWPLLTLKLLTFWPWLGLRLVACTGDLPPWICDWAFIVPLIPGLLIAALLAYGLFILIRHGLEFENSPEIEKKSWANPKKGSHFVRAGYRRLGATPQKHVRWSALPFALGLAELLGFWSFYFGLPATASMLLAAATVAPALVFIRWLRRAPSLHSADPVDNNA